MTPDKEHNALADFPINDPTNPAHRLADDLRRDRIKDTAVARDIAQVLSALQAAEAELETLLHTPKPVDPDMAAMFVAETERADRAERERDEARAGIEAFCLDFIMAHDGSGEDSDLRSDSFRESVADLARFGARSVLTGEKVK